MTTDPMLEAIYKRAQEQEAKRVAKQAKFDKDIADGVPIPKLTHPRCGSVKDGTQCGYPLGHVGQHSSGPYLRWE